MAEFINTIDILGDDAVMDSIINRTITEFNDNICTSLGSHAFAECRSLTTVRMPKVTALTDHEFMNSSLTTAEFPALKTLGGGTSGHSFDYTMLTKLYLPSLTEVLFNGFRLAIKLVTVDLPVVEKIDRLGFYQCPSLRYVILRGNKVCVLQDDGAFDQPGITPNPNIKIFVPAALLNTYKQATNWTLYAEQLYALEDYTVDGTITGELDETKI